MEIQSKRGKIYRMRPRHNPEVNGYWMCDEGRLNYKFVNENRIERPSCRSGGDAHTVSFEEALGNMRITLGFEPAGPADGPSNLQTVVLASATCTLEEMYQAKRLARDVLDAPVFVARHVPDGVEDHLLRRADKHPNTSGAQLLGLNVLDLIGDGNPTAVQTVEDALGDDGVLFCVGFNYEVSAALARLAAGANKVVAIAACKTDVSDGADLVVPGLTFAEKLGLMVNFEGHVQKLGQAIDYAPDFAPTAQKERNAPHPVSDWKVLEELISSLRGDEAVECISVIRRYIVENEAAFSNVDLQKVGPLGLRLSRQPVG
jgi:NADH-quinone oxidoreductase subunit G